MRNLFCGPVLMILALAASAADQPPTTRPQPEKTPPIDKEPVIDLPGVAPRQPEVLKKQAPELGQVQRWIGKPPIKSNKDLLGKVSVVYFWSSDSSSSLDNMVCFAQWRKLYLDQGLQFIAIHTCDLGQPFPLEYHEPNQKISKEEEQSLTKLTAHIKQVAKSNPAVIDTGVDTDGDMKQSWKVRRTPTFYLVDKKGYVRYQYEGFLEYQKLHKEPLMRAKIEELLKEEADK